MKTTNKVLIYLATGLVILVVLFAWVQTRNKDTGTAAIAMLEDESVTPAPYDLIRIQEQPVFQMDNNGMQFAALDDLEDRIENLTDDNPLIIQESKPK